MDRWYRALFKYAWGALVSQINFYTPVGYRMGWREADLPGAASRSLNLALRMVQYRTGGDAEIDTKMLEMR